MADEEPPPNLLSQPDLMNDPAFDPNIKRREGGGDDGDTCRICRSEGSTAEPLFYPCKCSGSIKFVHQECLMQWLSHSQKKHCELCKTPFRFTKLYHPQMPSTVPFLVFLKQGAFHIVQSLLTWARWNLVILVWLGWLPWSMRIIWRSLFYIGDGGWITPYEMQRRWSQQASAVLHGTSAASSCLANPTSPAAPRQLAASIGSFAWNPWGTATPVVVREPLMFRFARKIFKLTFYPTPDFSAASSKNATNTAASPVMFRSPSLLSNYQFLRNLTRSNAINNLAVDILEGQLITLLVVVGFILVFLIREWVVQQQPVVNAGLAADPAVGEDGQNAQGRHANEAAALDRQFEVEHGDRLQVEHGEANDDEVLADTTATVVPAADERAGTWEQNSDGASPQTSGNETHAFTFRVDEALQNGNSSLEAEASAVSAKAGSSSASTSTRPTLPHRGALSPASEIHRTLEEEAHVSGQGWPGLDVFKELWERAGHDPEEVLRIIRADGKENELSWIVSKMVRLQNGSPPHEGTVTEDPRPRPEDDSGSGGSSWVEVEETSRMLKGHDPDRKFGLAEETVPTAQGNPVPPLDLAALHRARVERQNLMQTGSSPIASSSGADESREVENGRDQINGHGEEQNDVEAPEQQEATAGRDSHEDFEHNSDSTDSDVEPVNATVPQAIRNWFWGDIPNVAVPDEEPGEDDEHIVQDLAEEPPFVPVENGQLLIANNEQEVAQDPEVLQDARDAGINPNDADGLDDGEDLEGILELIGAQGPLVGLIQNSLFSALLIAISFVVGVWVPYVMGKVVLVFAANPVALFIKMPLRWISTWADLIVDGLVFLAGGALYIVDTIIRTTASPFGRIIPFVHRAVHNRLIGTVAAKYARKSAVRLSKTVAESTDMFAETDVPLFSIVAHESLVAVKSSLYQTFLVLLHGVQSAADTLQADSTAAEKAVGLMTWLLDQTIVIGRYIAVAASAAFSRVDFRSLSLHINFDTPQRIAPLDFSLAHWPTQDRVIAILIGYAFFLLAGSTYLTFYANSTDASGAERPRGHFIDSLVQAGGVTKVILIISIEMIVFPLYCGALLDVALLPLFEHATVASRVAFTLDAPLTSIFIHWFIGTCYMFHFALFVSMCRKILRNGVLHFIRDPDDPSFHPVRDVLERNVYTQLRKIAFSALVYGGLVIVCLGTVVWGIAHCTASVFPIRWASSGAVLESPVDLLVYNFVMPFAVNFSEPATVLHTVYNWWFRKCARWLRLTHFLFGDRVEDEMYVFLRDPYKRIRVKDTTLPDEHLAEEYRILRAREIASYYLNGQFVRAPASDQVRLPKGVSTFVPVDEFGNRTDNQPDSDQGLHGRNNRLFKKIFIPPHFPTRIAAFLLLLWLFAAAMGVTCTLLPLLLGRALFHSSFPADFQVNDIYAFAVGAYVLGAPIYLGVRFAPAIQAALAHLAAQPSRTHLAAAVRQALARTGSLVLRALRLLYFYATLGLILPALTGLMWEAYVVVPLLTLSHPAPTPPYTIRFVQSWTLAVVALKFAATQVLRRRDSTAARALRALVSPANRGAGWADPDVRLATRAIVVPALAAMTVALALPPALAAAALRCCAPDFDSDATRRPLAFRYAYPAVLGAALVVLAGRGIGRGLRAWQERVRDEVFLVGERLHNFGERSGPPPPSLRPGSSARVELG